MTKEVRSTKDQSGQKFFRILSFGFLSSFVIRVSSFWTGAAFATAFSHQLPARLDPSGNGAHFRLPVPLLDF